MDILPAGKALDVGCTASLNYLPTALSLGQAHLYCALGKESQSHQAPPEDIRPARSGKTVRTLDKAGRELVLSGR